MIAIFRAEVTGFLSNDATATADSFMVSYTYNGGAPVTQEAYGLAPGASTTITFPVLNLSAGSHSIVYSWDCWSHQSGERG